MCLSNYCCYYHIGYCRLFRIYVEHGGGECEIEEHYTNMCHLLTSTIITNIGLSKFKDILISASFPNFQIYGLYIYFYVTDTYLRSKSFFQILISMSFFIFSNRRPILKSMAVSHFCIYLRACRDRCHIYMIDSDQRPFSNMCHLLTSTIITNIGLSKFKDILILRFPPPIKLITTI
jgi:hypothetical protein